MNFGCDDDVFHFFGTSSIDNWIHFYSPKLQAHATSIRLNVDKLMNISLREFFQQWAQNEKYRSDDTNVAIHKRRFQFPCKIGIVLKSEGWCIHVAHESVNTSTNLTVILTYHDNLFKNSFNFNWSCACVCVSRVNAMHWKKKLSTNAKTVHTYSCIILIAVANQWFGFRFFSSLSLFISLKCLFISFSDGATSM